NSWLTLGPEAIYWAPKFVQSLWDVKEIFITENGCASDDVIADDGNIYDTDRIVFLRAYLTQLHPAAADGVPVKGTFSGARWITSSGSTDMAIVSVWCTWSSRPRSARQS